MSKINDGGPAFPTAEVRAPDGTGIQEGALGMSKRDYIACRAMAAICAHIDTWGFDREQIAGEAYRIADAMLAERERQP